MDFIGCQRLYENKAYRMELIEILEGFDVLEKLSGKSILITGGTGLIGSGIVDALVYYNEQQENANRRIQIWVLSRNGETARSRFPYAFTRAYFHYVSQSIAEPITILEPIHYIIHAAGKGDPSSMIKDPVGIMESNILGTRQVLEFAMHQEGCKVTYISSGEIYGILYHVDEEGIRENEVGRLDPLVTRNCYGISKRAGENLCISYREEYDIDVNIARLAHTYGATAMEGENRVIFQFLHKALSGKDIVLKSSGEQKRSWTYLSDAVCGILTILLTGESGQAYNVSNTAAACSIYKLAQIIAETCGVSVVLEVPNEIERKGNSGISNAVLNNEKLLELGCQMRVNVPEAIERIQEIYDEDNWGSGM